MALRSPASFPPRFTSLFASAQTSRIVITLDSYEEAIRLRWRLQRFRQCHPKTHEARLITLSVRRNVLTLFRRDIIPPHRIQETPQ